MTSELDEVLAGWFSHARDDIDKGETEDSAGASDPIRLLLPKATVLQPEFRS